MKGTYVICHGMGESSDEWEAVRQKLTFPTECPRLFSLAREDPPLTYEKLFAAFEGYCAELPGPLHLCGLSLGGVLALQYACLHGDRVSSLVLIGVPYEIPKAAFAFQNAVFRLLPGKAFREMGLSKKDAIGLIGSMKRLEIPAMAEKVTCTTLVLCGEKDRTNLRSWEQLSGAVKGSRRVLLKGAGHQAQLDGPDHLAAVLEEFLKQTQ